LRNGERFTTPKQKTDERAEDRDNEREKTREKVRKSEKKRGNQWYNSIIRLIEE
jgi:hypothetical protein